MFAFKHLLRYSQERASQSLYAAVRKEVRMNIYIGGDHRGLQRRQVRRGARIEVHAVVGVGVERVDRDVLQRRQASHLDVRSQGLTAR